MAIMLPKDKPENLTIPELEKWLTVYSQEIFPSPTINFGGSIRRVQALRECLKIAFKLQTGTLETLIFAIMRSMGINKGKASSDYIETLIDFEVIQKNSPNWKYIGKNPLVVEDKKQNDLSPKELLEDIKNVRVEIEANKNDNKT